jgi:Tol biopolymer transport system component/DNA-binding winged helix-turn-helix (wHTH) protein
MRLILTLKVSEDPPAHFVAILGMKAKGNPQGTLKFCSKIVLKNAMQERPKHFYEFSHFRIDPEERVLLHDGKVVPLTPKVFDTLLSLVEHCREVVSKDELMNFVWPNCHVEEGNLTQNISTLRKLLGESPNAPQYIETVPRRGYRFVAPVEEVVIEPHELAIASPPAAETAKVNPPIAIRRDVSSVKKSIRARLRTVVVQGLLLIGMTGLVVGLYKKLSLDPTKSFSATMTVNRLTYTGKASRIAISPDGKYVVMAVAEAGKQSLWLRQVAAASEIQIVPPAEVSYLSLTFSADGNFLYFVRGHQNGPNEGSFIDRGTLYKMPVLGKSEKKLSENVDSHITLSPDGEWLAFVRQYPNQGKSSLMLARTDGTEEKELVARKFPDSFLPGGPAWSPDGKIIACSNNNFTADTPYRGIVGIRIADGAEEPIGSKHWYGATRRLVWLTDGSGLLVLGAEYSRGLNQLWRLSYPGTEANKVISDLNNYADLSLTADSRMMAVVRADRVVNIWVAPDGDASRAKLITTGTGREDGVRGLTWTHDGRIVYRSMSGEAPQIWIMGADGTGAKQLSVDGSEHFDPAVAPDGHAIIWSSSATGQRNIWRMGLDGSNPTQITHGSNKWFPQYTPDGKWLVYMSGHLVKVPARGGAPVRLTNGDSSQPAISPDGKWIAYNRLDEASGQWQIAVMPMDVEAAPRIFDVPSPNRYRALRWTPDGHSIAYPVSVGNVSNIWGQPLDGGPPRQLTNFKDQIIFDFAWSRDGQQLALSRGIVNSDIVLISKFR